MMRICVASHHFVISFPITDVAKFRSRLLRLQSLTPREREVLAMVTSGKANKIMAADLGVSQRTIEIHRARVMEKMSAASLAKLVRMVMDRDEKVS